MTATIEAPQIKRQSKSAQMRKYGFFPGCVAKESCKELFNSTMLLADKLGSCGANSPVLQDRTVFYVHGNALAVRLPPVALSAPCRSAVIFPHATLFP